MTGAAGGRGALGVRATALALGAAFVLAAALVLLATARDGAGVSPDSVMYLSAARSLLAGHGFVTCEGTPLVEWAPLMPLLMALLSLARLDPFAALRIAGALVAGAIAALAGAWVWRRTRSAAAAACAALGMAASLPLVQVASYVWSDAPFALLALGAALAVDRSRGRPGARRALVPAAWAGLACLARYVGGTVVIAGALFYLLESGRALRDRLGAALVFVLAACLPIGLWVIRNVMLSGTAAGGRVPATRSVLVNAYQLATPLADGLAPWSWPVPVKLAAIAVVTLACLAVVARRRRLRPAPIPPPTGIGALELFAVCYAVGLVVVSSMWESDVIDARLALPLWVAVLPPAVAAVRGVVAGPGGRALRPAGATALALVAVLWLARTGVVAAREVEGCRRDGLWSLTDRYWRRSRLRATLAALPARGLLFTNAPEACYLATGRYARLVPFRVERASEEERDEAFSPMREAVAGGRPVFLVWGWGWRVGQLVPLADVQARFRLRWTYWGRDGVVFRVSPRPP